MLSAGVIETLPIFAKCPKIKETNKQPPVVVSEKFLNLNEPTITPKIAAIAKTQKPNESNCNSVPFNFEGTSGFASESLALYSSILALQNFGTS